MFTRPIAIGALITTTVACILAMIQMRIDVGNDIFMENCSIKAIPDNSTFEPEYPAPTAKGYFAAFGSIMFAFGGASTFPTIQADMGDKHKFKWAAVIAMGSKKQKI